MNAKKSRIARSIMATARECGYTVEGDIYKFWMTSKYIHCADFWVQYNRSSGYFEGFIYIERLWVNPGEKVTIDDEELTDHDGFLAKGWSHGLWSIRNTMDSIAFCNMISTSMALRGKSKNRVEHNVTA